MATSIQLIRRIKRKTKRLLGITLVGIERCDHSNRPVANYEGGSWVEIEVTPDQARIEDALSKLDLENKSLLHVGVGSSHLAKKLSKLNVLVDGITVISDEKAHAVQLELPNYRTFIINKYNEQELCQLNTNYDFIVDNNLSSFACCKFHYRSMIASYIRMLKINGMIITDQTGMKFCEDYAFPIDYKDLQDLENRYSVKALKLSESVFAVQKIPSEI